LASAFRSELEMLMPLQRFYRSGKEGDESFGADAVGGVPGQEQRVLDVWSRLGSHAWTQAHAIRSPHG